jgi:hypothetical protein
MAEMLHLSFRHEQNKDKRRNKQTIITHLIIVKAKAQEREDAMHDYKERIVT